jgi:glycosyltransferase involved in cell wall biosynthesis
VDIGFFGLWGMNIPGLSFGGFETVYSEVSERLSDMGHHVTVYSRRACYPEANRPSYYRGVQIVYVPTLNTKNWSFLTATTSALGYALWHAHHDVYLFANVGSGFHCLIARMLGKRVVLNVDGLDWVRPKWSRFGQAYFRLAAKAALFSGDALITDSDAMIDFYLREFGRKLEMISYGAAIEDSIDVSLLGQLQVKPRNYYLVITRLIPDNNVDVIIEAFERIRTDRQLIIIGDANYDGEYQRKLRQVRDPRIRFIGRIHSQDLIRELYCNCYAYVHGHSVGGTNPALLRALGYGGAVLALNTVFNSEVLSEGRYGILWERSVDDLSAKLQDLEDNPQKATELRARAPERIRRVYTWEQVTKKYIDLLNHILNGRSDSRCRILFVQWSMLGAMLLIAGLAVWLIAK